MTAIETLRARLRSGDGALPSLYKGDAPDISDIREYLSKYKGGSVDLEVRDDGIAMVTLNNPAKRNAMSGKYSWYLPHIIMRVQHSEG